MSCSFLFFVFLAQSLQNTEQFTKIPKKDCQRYGILQDMRYTPWVFVFDGFWLCVGVFLGLGIF